MLFVDTKVREWVSDQQEVLNSKKEQKQGGFRNGRLTFLLHVIKLNPKDGCNFVRMFVVGGGLLGKKSSRSLEMALGSLNEAGGQIEILGN